MTKAEKWLQEYIDNRTHYNLLLIEIDDITTEIIEKISFPSISASIISDMPRSQTNKFHSTTEINALLEGKLNPSLQAELVRRGRHLEKCNNILAEILTAGEIFLLSKRYFEKDIHGKPYTWSQIAGAYTRQYKLDYIDKDTVKVRLRRKILPMLERML